MTNITEIGRFGTDPYLIYYFETADDGFDSAAGTRDLSFRLFAVSTHTESVSLSGYTYGKLTVFGKNYSLQRSYTFNPNYEHTLLTRSLTGLSMADYESSALVTLLVGFNNTPFGGNIKETFNTVVPLGSPITAPTLSAVGSVTELGSSIRFVGEGTEGYTFSASVKDGVGRVVTVQTLDANGEITTSPSWMLPFPSDTEMSVEITLTASFEGDSVGGSQVLTHTLRLTEALGKPDCSPSVSFLSDGSVAESLGFGLKNRSRALIDASSASAKHGATVSSVEITYRGIKRIAASVETPVLTDSGTHTYSVTVTDSRGFKTAVNGSFEVVEYAPPSFTASVTRCEPSGTESKSGSCVAITASTVSFFPFDGANSVSYSYAVAEAGSGQYGAFTPFSDGTLLIADLALDPLTPYDVCIRCTDTVGSTAESVYTLDCNRVELNIQKNRVAVGKYATVDRLLDSAWSIHSDKDVIATDSLGNQISLRSAALCQSLTAASEADISSALSYTGGVLKLVLISVEVSGLSLTPGNHLFLVHSGGCLTLV